MLALHINFRPHGFRWPLPDEAEVEVWSPQSELVATLSGRLIRQLVELHLAGVAITGHIAACVVVKKPPILLPRRGGTRPERVRLSAKRRTRSRS
jgi:hypothetical protein